MNIQQISATYMDHMGSDLTVVNAARASFDKESTWEPGSILQEDGGRRLKQSDANLIRFLATGYRAREWAEFLQAIHQACMASNDSGDTSDLELLLRAYKNRPQHWAPFAHPHLQLRMTIPMFLARQFVKHQVGAVWSEESRRYVSDEPAVWFPQEWHTRPEDIKQGSGELVELQEEAQIIASHSTQIALNSYDDLLAGGVAPEEARTVLPLNTMTTVVWTGSLLFWSRVANQRVDAHAQLAAQELGKKISAIVQPRFPVSWAALVPSAEGGV